MYTMMAFSVYIISAINSLIVDLIFSIRMTVTIILYDNQPDICAMWKKCKKVIQNWWKYRKHKIPTRYKPKRSGYYVHGNKNSTARICYLTNKGMTKVRKYCERIVSCQAEDDLLLQYEENTQLGIDTLSTYCMTNNMQDFSETPRSIALKVTGISDSLASVTKVGRGTFKILDDNGMMCVLPVPELYYCSTAPYRIISPQHLDRTWRSESTGTFAEATSSQHTRIMWTDEYEDEHTKTITHTSKSGVPICTTAPDYSQYKRYLQEHLEYGVEEKELIALLSKCNMQGIKEPYNMSINPSRQEEYALQEEDQHEQEKQKVLREDPILLDLHDEPEETNEDQPDEFQEMSAKTEKLLWHYRLGHTPFATINQMSQEGELPKRLAMASDPTCASCMYGRSTRRAWRTKAPIAQVGERTKITKSGDCVSIDQMESPVPGLVAHTKGSPTRERYNCATIFVDHHSDVSFVHLQQALTGDETLEAKKAFERWAKSHDVTIRHYHADNGRFAENKFLASVAECGQTISFCGVIAHFQNGKAERRIRTLQDLGRTQLLHALARWPVAITTHLWPYAVANVASNDQKRQGDNLTRIEKFSGSEIEPNMKNHHHIGIPVYVLDNDLQAGKKIPKWMPRARVVIYLGKSPRHARNVALVLNPRTGLVSPQFHVRFDDTFETVKGRSKRVILCGKQSVDFRGRNPRRLRRNQNPPQC
jgi:hypothetical protein